MVPSSRTPEGTPNYCPLCGAFFEIEPSIPPGDAPCPQCGHLVWFGNLRPPKDIVLETKLRIRTWVGHISRLANSAPPTDVMARELVTGMVEMLAACGGAIWWCEQPQPYKCLFAIGRSAYEEMPPEFPEFRRQAIFQVLTTAKPRAFGPQVDDGLFNPSGYLMIYAPVQPGVKTPSAIVEIVQRPGARQNTRRGYMRFVTQMCEIVGRHYRFSALG